MFRKIVGFLLVCAVLTIGGCAKNSANKNVFLSSSTMSLRSRHAYAASPQRFIAVHQKFEVIASESELPKAWQSVIDFCATIQCEVISSSITTKTRYLSPSGNISLRVVPDDLKKLFAFVEKQGTVAQHSTETEDKTSDVIDTEAKIKNLTSFRDNLRAMLAKPSATVKDSVEIQQQLMEVQSQLDSELIQRKVLSNETEKTTVEIAVRVELSRGEQRGWGQIWSAFRESGDVLADSVYWLIIVVVGIAPWLALIAPVVWLVVSLWSKRRKKNVANSEESR